jgi:hypothetical protein
MRWEYRLYFPTNRVSQCASQGDLPVIAKRNDNTLLAIVAEQGTTIERQLLWLFGYDNLSHPGFSVRSELEMEKICPNYTKHKTSQNPKAENH